MEYPLNKVLKQMNRFRKTGLNKVDAVALIFLSLYKKSKYSFQTMLETPHFS